MNAETKKFIDRVKFFYNLIDSQDRSYAIKYCQSTDNTWSLVSKQKDIITLDNLIEGTIEHSRPSAIRVVLFDKKKQVNTLDLRLVVGTHIALLENGISERIEEQEIPTNKNMLNGIVTEEDLKSYLGGIERSFEAKQTAFETNVTLNAKNQEIIRLKEENDILQAELLDAYADVEKLDNAISQYKSSVESSTQKDTLMTSLLGLATTFITGNSNVALKGLVQTPGPENNNDVSFEELKPEKNTHEQTDPEIEKVKEFLSILEPQERKYFITGLQYIEKFDDKRLPLLELKELFEQEQEYKVMRLEELIEKNK